MQKEPEIKLTWEPIFIQSLWKSELAFKDKKQACKTVITECRFRHVPLIIEGIERLRVKL